VNSYLFEHLFRAWSRHWVLQLASVTVMTLVLVLLNFLFLGYSAFNGTLNQWGKGLEMVVYLKDGATPESLEKLRTAIGAASEFESSDFISKDQATKKFLTSLGPESLELLKDPKWSSPIPASLELRLSQSIPVKSRVPALQMWSAKLKGMDIVEDVFYGQGWVENFTNFVSSARGMLAVLWLLSLSVGLLIVSNCIRLSFWQRKEEIEILELVGATSGFVRTPFLFEGLMLGFVASILSLLISFVFHSMLLSWLSQTWSFWAAIEQVQPLGVLTVVVNFVTALFFGLLGAWNCVRKINTGWSAAVS
jgi:cell division transport system permease protein